MNKKKMTELEINKLLYTVKFVLFLASKKKFEQILTVIIQ
jgi:hypothetical protein